MTERFRHQNLFSLIGDSHHRIAFPQNMWVGLQLNQLRRDLDLCLGPEEWSVFDGTFHDKLFVNDADAAFRSFEDLLFRRIALPGSLFLAAADTLYMEALEELVLSEYADLYPRGLPDLMLYPVSFTLEDVFAGIKDLLRQARQPMLAYLHLWPPHEHYRPRREYVGRFDDGWSPEAKEPHILAPGQAQKNLDTWRREYDAYIAHTDAEFGRLYDSLRETGFLDNSYVVITSDHGQLFERGVHGHDTALLYEPVIHVPLLIARPGQQQREDVYSPTSTVDLLPTLLEAMSLPIPGWCEGLVLPTSGPRKSVSERPIFSVEAKRNAAHGPLTIGTIALIRDRYKLIHYFGYPVCEHGYELYDLANDPEELDDLFSSKRSIATDLRNELAEKLEEVNEPYRR
jgi:hypothetical protein